MVDGCCVSVAELVRCGAMECDFSERLGRMVCICERDLQP